MPLAREHRRLLRAQAWQRPSRGGSGLTLLSCCPGGWPSVASTSGEDSQNDDRIFGEGVTDAVGLDQEEAKTGVRLVPPHGIHLWKLGDHLDSTENSFPRMPGKAPEGVGRWVSPKDSHRALVRRRPWITLECGTRRPSLCAASPPSIASRAWRCERIASSTRSTLSRSAKYRRASLTTKLLLPARGSANAF